MLVVFHILTILYAKVCKATNISRWFADHLTWHWGIPSKQEISLRSLWRRRLEKGNRQPFFGELQPTDSIGPRGPLGRSKCMPGWRMWRNVDPWWIMRGRLLLRRTLQPMLRLLTTTYPRAKEVCSILWQWHALTQQRVPSCDLLWQQPGNGQRAKCPLSWLWTRRRVFWLVRTGWKLFWC